jgi:rubrerythrin
VKTLENLKAALEQEETAIANYLRYAEETDDLQIQEMFRQFAKNESWHASALKEKIVQLEKGAR